LAINHLETIEKSKIFGRLCRLKILKEISIDEFHRLTKLIQDAYIPDLNLVKYFEEERAHEIYEEENYPIITLGLIHQVPSEQTPIEYQPEYEGRNGTVNPSVSGGEIMFHYYLSPLGKSLLRAYDKLIPIELQNQT